MAHSASAQPFVSIIVATYQREKILCETIESILKQDYPHFEIIIVDQTAKHEPATEKFIQHLAKIKKIQWIQTPIPCTPRARNIGLAKTKGEFVIFVDDDTELKPHFIQHHLSNYDNPKVAAVGGKVLIHPVIPNPYYVVCTNPLKDWWWFNFDWDKKTEIATVIGCNMSFRKNPLEKIGRFDEFYKNDCWGEEADPCFRLRKAGYNIVYDPKAELIHYRNPNGGSRSKGKDHTLKSSLYRNMTYFFLKNLGRKDLLRHFILAYRCNVGQEKEKILHSPTVFLRFIKRNAAFCSGFLQGTFAILLLILKKRTIRFSL